MKNTILVSLFTLCLSTFADMHDPEKLQPHEVAPVGINLTKEQLKDEFMDSCKIDCPEIKHGATCSVFIKGLGKIEKKGDNRCLAFKAICETVKTKKLDPKKATEHSCSHP